MLWLWLETRDSRLETIHNDRGDCREDDEDEGPLVHPPATQYFAMHNHSKTKTKMGRRATVCLPLLSFFLATSAVAIDIDIVADAYEDVTDSSSSRQRSDHRRRQLGGARVNQKNDDAPDGKVNDAFYDLSLMTKDEVRLSLCVHLRRHRCV